MHVFAKFHDSSTQNEEATVPVNVPRLLSPCNVFKCGFV